MATSGQLNTNTAYDSYFWVKWEQDGDQDVANNRTHIKWSCGVSCGHSFYSNAIKMSGVYIDGVLVYSGGTYSNFSKGSHTIASGTMWIGHNTDGTKKFNISSFTGWLYSNYNYSSNGGSYELTAIPRQATITAAADFKDTDNPSITVNNPGGFRMDVWLEPNPVGDHLCVRENISLDNTGKYTWTLTDAERDELRNKCPGDNCTIRLGLYTRIGSATYHDYKDKKFTVTENTATKPVVSMDATLNNGSLPYWFADLWIQGKSKVDVSLSAEGKYNATINRYSAQVDGKTYIGQAFTSDVIQSSGNVEIIGYAKDSREITGSDSQTVNVIEYSKPLVLPGDGENAILCYRSDGNGKRIGNSTSVWIKAKKSYYSVEGKNTCSLLYRVKRSNDSWGEDEFYDWEGLIYGDESQEDEYNGLIDWVFDLKTSYTVQIAAIDDIGESDIKTFEIPTQDVALHLGKGGKNVAVGTYCDTSRPYTFYSEWDAIFDKKVFIGGTQVIDHIVEEGVDDVWHYRIWVNGIAECWGVLEAEAEYQAGTTPFGTASVSYSQRKTEFPDIFAEIPMVFVSLNDTGLGVASAANEGSTAKECKVTLFGTNTAMGSASVLAIGRWKTTQQEEIEDDNT